MNFEDNLYNALIKFIRDLFTDEEVTHVIRANQQGVRPTERYVSVNLLNTTRIGMDSGEQIDNDTMCVRADRVANFSISVFREGSFDVAEKISAALQTRQDNIIRRDENEDIALQMGVNTVSEVRSIPTIVKNVYEPRAQLDASFNTMFTLELSRDSIGGARITIAIRDGEDICQVLQTFTVTEPST